MKNSKQYLKDKEIMQRISFKKEPKHTVKLLEDKLDTIPDGKGGEISGMKYLVEENGVQKSIFTSSNSLIEQLSDLDEGTVVTVEMKSKNVDGKFISYYEVVKGEINMVGDDTETVKDESGF